MENLTLDDPMEATGAAARPVLGAAPASEGSSGSRPPLGGTPATVARQRKPGRWKRFPRVVPPTHSEHAVPPTHSEHAVPPTHSKHAVPPTHSKHAVPPVRFPKAHFPKGYPPPGTKKFAPFLPSFWAFQPPPTPQRETAPTPQRETFRVVYVTKGSREDKEAEERSNQKMLKFAKQLEEAEDDDDWDEEARAKFRTFKAKFVPFYRRLATTKSEDVVFNTKPPGDTREEHLTAEDMEMEADRSGWPVCPQACHFATLALEHYNSSKKTHKFEMTEVLLSKCFSEADGTTFAHVNFTAATPQQSSSHPAKRLFFAELMLIPDLQAYGCIEPMRVLHVCTIDDSCFGGCHEMVRDIKGPVRKDLDYDRCHACSQRIKHPRVFWLEGARSMLLYEKECLQSSGWREQRQCCYVKRMMLWSLITFVLLVQ